MIKRCCDVFGQISILPPAVFLQTLLFRPWREFFKSGETHLWNLHTLSTRDPPYHTLCFYIYKTQEQRVFFSKLFRIFCRSNIQGNLSIMIKILVMSTASLIADKKKDLVNLIRSKRLVANANAYWHLTMERVLLTLASYMKNSKIFQIFSEYIADEAFSETKRNFNYIIFLVTGWPSLAEL